MRQTQSSMFSWQTLVFLVAGVAAIVIIALLLAQVDNYQRRSAIPANEPAVLDLEATVAAGDLSIIYLPGDENATPTVQVAPTEEALVVAETSPATPTALAKARCHAPRNWAQFTVVPGDTLPKLARAHETSVYHIVKANCLRTYELETGQKIFLPVLPRPMSHPRGADAVPYTWLESPAQAATPSWSLATPAIPLTSQ
jgi:LysM repeat protein